MDDIKAVICPKCKRVISNYQETCPFCGQPQHSIQARLLKRFNLDRLELTQTVVYLNIGLFILAYLLPIILGAGPKFGRGMFGLPAPSGGALSLLGWASLDTVLSGEYWRLVTAMFLHGGPAHIFFNMMWVKNLAPITRSLMSAPQVILVFLLSGLAGNIAAVFFPLFKAVVFGSSLRNVAVIGASGAIFGIMGAIIVVGREKGGLAGFLLVKQVISWAAIIIVLGFLIPGISNSAHIGGLLAGLLLGKLFCLRSKTLESMMTIFSLATLGISALAFLIMIFRLGRVFLSI